MRFLTSLSILAATMAVSFPAFAQSATKNVVVSATLTSVCRFTSSLDLPIALGTYVAFRTTALTKSATADIECTRHTNTPTLTFDSEVGIINGLTYTVSVGPGFVEALPGNAPDGSAGSVGTPRTGSVTVTASIPPLQAGSGAGGLATEPVPKVLTVAF